MLGGWRVRRVVLGGWVACEEGGVMVGGWRVRRVV